MDPTLRRALDFERWLYDAVVEELIQFRWGVAGFSEELGVMWDLNFVRVDSNDAPPAAELVELADRLHRERGQRFRSIPVFDPQAAARLRPSFDELGWHRDGIVVMVHRRPPDKQPAVVDVRESDEATISELRDQLRREEKENDDDVTEEVLEQWGRLDPIVRRYAGTR